MQGRKQQSTAKILFLLTLEKVLADTNSTDTSIFSMETPHYSDMTIGLLSLVGVLTLAACILGLTYDSIKKCCQKKETNATPANSLPMPPTSQSSSVVSSALVTAPNVVIPSKNEIAIDIAALQKISHSKRKKKQHRSQSEIPKTHEPKKWLSKSF